MLKAVTRDRVGMRACERMLQEIEQDVCYTRHLLGLEALSAPVLQALRDVPRHAFVPDALQDAAYDNRPLPIGENQTISQPYIVAIMTELLALNPEHQVLEVGTGSGYQTAVLARLVKLVYSIEIVETLAKRAASRLKHLGFHNVEMRIGDGYNGWPEAAPFDAIIITAAADRVPPPLLEQLKPGGRLIVPLNNGFDQELVLLSKASSGAITQRKLLPVAFVPMTGLARDNNGNSSS
ncbi:MAG TPA: protein-L-isoaspartate(D-aspartate) O-methyltransferase [Gammaproteobacteria bacterium]|nr:protein-L-isoaspartate(D-aspartate) O-methyltransferase [Gammaproteobacteria bacterium]